MHFRVSSETIVLQCDPSLDKTQVSLKSLVKSFIEERQGILLELGSIEVELKKALAEVHNSIGELL